MSIGKEDVTSTNIREPVQVIMYDMEYKGTLHLP